jgi:glycosyltransferase involved in cell wall biosynthesis
VENNTFPPDIRVWREARTAKQAGYDVSVISPWDARFPAPHEVIDGIEIYRHPSLNSGGGIFNQVVEYANAFLWEAFLSLKVFLKNRFDVIHGANPPDHIFILAAAFKPFGVKFVFDHHDLAPELYLCKFNSEKNIVYRVLSLMEKLSYRGADAVVSTNESYKRHVVARHGVKPEKVFVVRNDPEVGEKRETGNQVQGRQTTRPSCCTWARSTPRMGWICWSGRCTSW